MRAFISADRRLTGPVVMLVLHQAASEHHRGREMKIASEEFALRQTE